MYRLLSLLLSILLLFSNTPSLKENEPDTTYETISISSPSAVLLEPSSGQILYAKDAHSLRHPASITKIMTLILIFDALEKKELTLTESVVVSEYAASMGGSQVFLEAGETQTVESLIKCISIASANDACVAMAEHLFGSEQAFVNEMNVRAKSLGMEHTHFVNCCGLDVEGHLTCAYDVALMSQELILKYPQIHNYCTIWMENITHITKRGTSNFGLTNTNKLIRQYEYATGLKTGSTSLAKYCVSATAMKNDVELIAVIMAAPDYKIRFKDAITLLNYGFSKCHLYTDENTDLLPNISVTGGVHQMVPLKYQESFRYMDTENIDFSGITKEIQLPDSISAPITKGDVVGKAVYKLGDTVIGSVHILSDEDVAEAYFKDYLQRVFFYFLV